MAPPTSLLEFKFYKSAASLESPLARKLSALERLAEGCDSGAAYDQRELRVRGKWRTVSVPNRPVDWVQRNINSFLFPIDLPASQHAHGYVARGSIVTNARPHVGAAYLQKYDIKDFFDCIQTVDIAGRLSEAGLGTEPAHLIARLVSCNGTLPLGARTSPRVSNLILLDFDETIAFFAESLRVTYTRYADDLSFSSDSPFDVHEFVETSLASRGFSLNAAKSKSFKRGQPMFVTGLSVEDDQHPRLRKRFKRSLRQHFYYIEKYGLESHADRHDEDPRQMGSVIMGRFHYARSVEPQFADRLAEEFPRTFGELIPERRTDRLERVERHRAAFLERVERESSSLLPFYTPIIPVPLTP